MTNTNKREAILDAAYTQFSRYGYRKTSMDDISRGMGISRASLYFYFENKDEIFRSLSLRLHEQSLEGARVHLSKITDADQFAQCLYQALLARHVPFQETLAQSPHGAELYDEYSRLCGDIVVKNRQQFLGLLAKTLLAQASAGQINLTANRISGVACAEILSMASDGLKQDAAASKVFRKRLQRFVSIFIAGLR